MLPKASSLIESLRDIGYSFESAIADIIDNSITANAKNIKIYFDFHNQNLSLAIIDDGYGMTESEIIEAMRAGSKNPLDTRSENDLGRFGLGLKTASFSQCRKLTVVSSQYNNKISAKWDLDFVAKTEDWSLQILDESEISNIYKINSMQESGTLVLWEDTDRIIDNTVSSLTEDIVYEKIDSVQKHLELVFHRYLKGKNKVNIFINDVQLKPFDPFHTKHTATQDLTEEIITINNSKIIIKPYILPHYTKISAHEYDYYAGEGGYLKNQGFYVYRNKRLLVSGTWFRLIPQSEMYKLARIQIDLPNSLDHLWKIDVKKSNASPPSIIRQRLKKIIEKIAGTSTRVYRARGHKSSSSNSAFWERHSARGEINYTINKEHPFIEKFIEDLSDSQASEFNNILNLIGGFFPKDALYSDIGNNNPKDINPISIPDIELEEMANNKIKMEQDFMTDDEFIKYFKSTEPFNIYTKDWLIFMENVI
ncbi:ATP-binding protein [Sulfurimonas sp. SAG-AH-194-C20]|nr:ATP-binding protein [Sulfurimonas sp. SAG-AH-194-C20]MDF1878858.1 ATP-binding protein [Sulfurimonas sp. SAG-AH-194-C20]